MPAYRYKCWCLDQPSAAAAGCHRTRQCDARERHLLRNAQHQKLYQGQVRIRCDKMYLNLHHSRNVTQLRTAVGSTWWRHQMETFSVFLALCEGNSLVTGEVTTQRPVTQSFVVFFDLRPNKRLSKQSWCWWSETPSRSLWRHYNEVKMIMYFYRYHHSFSFFIIWRRAIAIYEMDFVVTNNKNELIIKH